MFETFIMRLFGKKVIKTYEAALLESLKMHAVNKSLMVALEFYADEESYEGEPVPVMEDKGMEARVALMAAKEMVDGKVP